MFELIIKTWYRKQKFIDEYQLYKTLLLIVMLIFLFILNTIFYLFMNFNTIIESFVFINIFSLLLTQYNIHVIQEELKTRKNNSLLHNKKYYIYLLYTVLKRNPLILFFILILIINTIFNLSKLIVILSCFFIQFNLFISKMINNKYKLLIFILQIIYILFTYLNVQYYVNIIIFIINIYIYLFIYKYNLNKLEHLKSFYNSESLYLKNSYLENILTYFKRINKKEYIEVLLSVIIAIIGYNFFGRKIIDYTVVFFFIAKLQLLIESKQINYKDVYLKNIFLKILKVPIVYKIKYSKEMKLLFLDSISIIIISIIFIIYDKKVIYPIIWGTNIILLLYLNLYKLLKVYYFYIDNKVYFKGTIINIILLYITLFIINIDYFIRFTRISISVEIIEMLKIVFILFFIFLKFENLFMDKSINNKEKYEF